MKRVGFGPYQYLSILSVSFAYFAEAAQIVTLCLVGINLKDEWDLSKYDTGILAGLAMLGMSVGAIVSSLICDEVGRLRIIRISLASTLILTIPSVFAFDFWFFIVCQVLLGFSNGLSLPVVSSYIIEICPFSRRSIFCVLAQLMFVIG